MTIIWPLLLRQPRKHQRLKCTRTRDSAVAYFLTIGLLWAVWHCCETMMQTSLMALQKTGSHRKDGARNAGKTRRKPSKTNRNRKAHDGIIQWSSLWFTLGLRRWSLWRNGTHTNPGHRQGDAVAERRRVNISTSLWRRRRGKDLALGFLFCFFWSSAGSWYQWESEVGRANLYFCSST